MRRRRTLRECLLYVRLCCKNFTALNSHRARNTTFGRDVLWASVWSHVRWANGMAHIIHGTYLWEHASFMAVVAMGEQRDPLSLG